MVKPSDIEWSWIDPPDPNAASARLYRSGAKDVPLASRVLRVEKTVPGPSYLEANGVLDGATPAYFQLVAASCEGDLESPY